MLKQFLETGQIVSTHGIKGEVRFDPWCDSPDFMKRFKTLYFDSEGKKPVKILSCRSHSNIVILKLEGVDTATDAQKLRNTILYMDRNDAKIKEGDWFVQDLLGCRVYDADDKNRLYGSISDVQRTGANDIWFIDGVDGREYIIPAIKDVVIDVDVSKDVIFIRPLKGIFDNIEEIRD